VSALRELLAGFADAIEELVDERIAEALDPEPVLVDPEPRLAGEPEPDLPFDAGQGGA